MRIPFISTSSSEQPNNPKNKKTKSRRKSPTPPSPKTVLPSSCRRPHALDAAAWCSFSSSSSSTSSSAANVALSPKDAPSTSRPSRSGSDDITREELDLVLRQLGGGGEDEVAAMIAEADRNGDGSLSVEELSMLIGQEEEEELRAVFGVFDADGDGRISAEELRGAFAMLGDESCSVDDCRRIIREVDSVGGGFVCYPDFARMMVMDGQR